MRRLFPLIVLALPLFAYEPPVQPKLPLLWQWSGRCTTPKCEAEETRFLATVRLYYRVQSPSLTATAEWRHDGTFLVNRVPLQLSSKQRAALTRTLESVREDLRGGTTWQQPARVLPSEAQVTLAFVDDGALHIAAESREYARKEYLPLLELLQPLVEPEAAARLTPSERETRIIGVRVRHDMPDHLAVDVEYFYDGSKDKQVFIGGNPLNETGVVLTGYRPNRIEKGRHTTCIVVTTYGESPDEFTTDTLKIELYLGGESVFHEAYVPLVKRWRKSEHADLRCCDLCTRGCGSL
jgi:hypothetical protein